MSSNKPIHSLSLFLQADGKRPTIMGNLGSFSWRLLALTLLGASALPAQSPVSSASNLSQLPLAFEKHGDRFLAHGQDYVVGIDSGKAVVRSAVPENNSFLQGLTDRDISLQFIGSRDVAAMAGEELPGKINYRK
jgi:hypothetical protein